MMEQPLNECVVTATGEELPCKVCVRAEGHELKSPHFATNSGHEKKKIRLAVQNVASVSYLRILLETETSPPDLILFLRKKREKTGRRGLLEERSSGDERKAGHKYVCRQVVVAS